MPEWSAPPKIAEITERRLLDAILDGSFPIDSKLPPERELAGMLGVTRPTLREALQRLSREGWLEIHHGKQTRVKNYWQEGNLLILNYLVHNLQAQPPSFVPNLLEVRATLAPVFTRLAFSREPDQVYAHLAQMQDLPDCAELFAAADLELQRVLSVLSGNPVYTLLFNSFGELYQVMAPLYFASGFARNRSRRFYLELYEAAGRQDVAAGEALTRVMMLESIEIWNNLKKERGQEV
ncbi:MAG TPA: fatty acid metabolism transcriptional regulator FadR [Anaerolineaceae bacterium]|jgi:GntR family negative regulator for fad regulon and positive regulator of fabA|nr:fatty acid metabolism transcriptional regulator FadR [Anaerolineales bacterium]HQK42223.1 fatty acid metabolism transcriptional regulator FadR [Anaerolineaceae bacterium]